MSSCYYCGPTGEELRPYGPGGARICFPCMKATPERETAAKGAYGAQLEMAEALGPVLIGTDAGPVNVDADDIAELISQTRALPDTRESR